eukprot:2616215-Heterocapsa_arctica.AAC.1
MAARAFAQQPGEPIHYRKVVDEQGKGAIGNCTLERLEDCSQLCPQNSLEFVAPESAEQGALRLYGVESPGRPPPPPVLRPPR